MVLRHRAVVRSGLAVVFALLIAGEATAQRVDKSASNLMVVLREWHGNNKPDETLRPMGKQWANFRGETIITEFAWYLFIGDMHVRFVFDQPQSLTSATAAEFALFHLTPEEAVERAIANIKRVYGEPITVPWEGGVMRIGGVSEDLDSSFFLDRELWRRLLAQHRDGLVVAVPNRGGLLFVPASDSKAVDFLRQRVGGLFRGSGKLGVSSALYLFKDDAWTVFQAPVGTR